MSSDFPNRSGDDNGKGQGSGERESPALYSVYPSLGEASKGFADALRVLSSQATPRLKDKVQPESVWVRSQGGETQGKPGILGVPWVD